MGSAIRPAFAGAEGLTGLGLLATGNPWGMPLAMGGAGGAVGDFTGGPQGFAAGQMAGATLGTGMGAYTNPATGKGIMGMSPMNPNEAALAQSMLGAGNIAMGPMMKGQAPQTPAPAPTPQAPKPAAPPPAAASRPNPVVTNVPGPNNMASSGSPMTAPPSNNLRNFIGQNIYSG